jgi:hypothetical protein
LAYSIALVKQSSPNILSKGQASLPFFIPTTNKYFMLQKVGSYNDIPKDMMPAPLKKGEVVTYQFVTGKPNPVPKDQRGKGPDIIYNVSIRIPTSDTIRTTDDRIIDIGVVDKIEDNRVVKTKFLAIRANDNGGFFSVTGGDVSSEIFYEFLELTNANESNPYRDESIAPLFKKVDAKRDAKMMVGQGEAIGIATNAVVGMNVGEMRKIAASLNMNSEEDPLIIRGELMKMAINTPEKFIKLIDNPDTQLKALVKRATELGLVNYVPVERKWVWNTGVTIARMDIVEGKDELDTMADWLKSHTNGQDVINKLKSLVNKEVKAAKKEKEPAKPEEVEAGDAPSE